MEQSGSSSRVLSMSQFKSSMHYLLRSKELAKKAKLTNDDGQPNMFPCSRRSKGCHNEKEVCVSVHVLGVATMALGDGETMLRLAEICHKCTRGNSSRL
jgi:hypothetical protein